MKIWPASRMLFVVGLALAAGSPIFAEADRRPTEEPREALRATPEDASRALPETKPKAPDGPAPDLGPRRAPRRQAVPKAPPRIPEPDLKHGHGDLPPKEWLPGVQAYSLIDGQRYDGLTLGYAVRLDFELADGIEPTHWRAAFGQYSSLPGHIAWKPWPPSGDPSLPIDPTADVQDFTVSAVVAIDGTQSVVRHTSFQYRKPLQDLQVEVLRHPATAQDSAELRLSWIGAATDAMVAPPGKEAPRHGLSGSPHELAVPFGGSVSSRDLVVQVRDHHPPTGYTRVLEAPITIVIDGYGGFEPVLGGVTDPGTTVPVLTNEPSRFVFATAEAAEVMAQAQGAVIQADSPDGSGVCDHRNDGATLRLTLRPATASVPLPTMKQAHCQYELFSDPGTLAPGWRVVDLAFSRHLERPSGEEEERDLRLVDVEQKGPQLPGSSSFWLEVRAGRTYPGDLVYLRLDRLELEGPTDATDWSQAFE